MRDAVAFIAGLVAVHYAPITGFGWNALIFIGALSAALAIAELVKP